METSSELDKKKAILLLASTILHEFGHQKQHLKKDGGVRMSVRRDLKRED